MLLAFADDSRQSRPALEGMGALVSAGAVVLDHIEARDCATDIEIICDRLGFPRGDEFKWSPGRELWMRDNLKDAKRTDFYLEVINALDIHNARIVVCMNDSQYATATSARTHEDDVTALLMERLGQMFAAVDGGMLIVDRPSGNRKEEDVFLGRCSALIESGTDFVQLKGFCHNVVSIPSKHSRLVQAADLIVGSVTARVGGEKQWSAAIFEALKPMFASGATKTSGYGLKIHPSKLKNLYHWLLQEDFHLHGNVGIRYPFMDQPFSEDPYE
jgi:hypothetical protein